MANIITVTCPHCGKPVAVNCRHTGGVSMESVTCRNCGTIVRVQYSNDSFGFRIIDVR